MMVLPIRRSCYTAPLTPLVTRMECATRFAEVWMAGSTLATDLTTNLKSLAGDGNTVRMQSGNTFRIAIDGSSIQHFTFGQVNPFGLAIDRRGDLFSADCHTKPISLLLQQGRYPSFGKPHDGLGFVPPVMKHLHGSTAIAGLALSGKLESWPVAYRDSSFGGNVMTSRINRNRLSYEGSSVSAEEEADFLVSNDPWFRPVDLCFGPDGALYIADFYNRIIGHYEVPLDHPGRDRTSGRIWRIIPKATQDASLADAPRDFTQLSVESLVEQLGSTNLGSQMLALDELTNRSHLADSFRNTTRNSNSPSIRSLTLWALLRRPRNSGGRSSHRCPRH